MANTFVRIASVTVGSGGASSIDFTSIPQTGYTDLVIKASVREASTSTFLTAIRFNGSTTNYSQTYLQGSGSTATSGTTTAIEMLVNASSTTANTFGNAEIYVPNYASSNNKSVLIDSVTETNATTVYMRMGANLWSNTAAITSIGIAITGGNIAQYSTAVLYGIKSS